MFNLNQGGLLYYIVNKNGIENEAWFYVLFFAFFLIMIAASYFLGSINSAILVSKLIYHDDVRKHGSGHPGLTNTLRTYGKGAAGLVLLGDMMKTALSILIGALLFGFWYLPGNVMQIFRISLGDGMCFVAGLFSVLGHIFPIYYKFKGGKGVLSTATMALILSPMPFILLLAVFVLIVYASRYVSLGSVSVAVLYPILIHAYVGFVCSAQLPGLISLSSIILAIVIVWRHKENLKRISDRTENKISFKKKPAAVSSEPEEQEDDE